MGTWYLYTEETTEQEGLTVGQGTPENTVHSVVCAWRKTKTTCKTVP